MTYTVVDRDGANTRVFDSKAEAQSKAEDLRGLVEEGADAIEVVKGEYRDFAEFIHDDSDDDQQGDPGTPAAKAADPTVEPAPSTPEDTVAIDAMAQNPIEWLEDKNTEFVYYKSGTPAISKQGFRYIQQQFGITTESELVHTYDDPRGVVVWARAERPNGQYAEAHGEGYITEGDVRDNEFVRYADSRAKNRAISDLTSAGALAVSELTNEQE